MLMMSQIYVVKVLSSGERFVDMFADLVHVYVLVERRRGDRQGDINSRVDWKSESIQSPRGT